MSDNPQESVSDLSIELFNSWGELHNQAKSLRLALRELLSTAEKLEVAVDSELGRLSTGLNDVWIQLEAQVLDGSRPMER